MTVSHLGICVTDLERAERFYVGAFGFERLRELSPPDGVTGTLLQVADPHLTAVYLGSGSFVLELLHFDREGNAPYRERSMTEPGLTHISFTVTDLAETCERIVELGGEVLRDTDVKAAVLVRDPDGQLLELVAARR
ncbi:VOC family protein [Aquihabitans sp. McL0605]|uniref:VOC family protein n=1 Tax=Aquihabitans sp. McL0605 TaxID=3415671 RepID=UPI003CF1B7A4